ncbi:PH domain-containing protein [bacterium]|nr:PH domain-containing protein [bacterium]MBU1652203.1 PH domain-containing protein [bacterium]MBU1880453.1 PH domain-containing protein [bacterium]
MEKITLKPEKGELTIWNVILWSVMLPILIGFIICAALVDALVFGIIIAVWLILSILFLIWVPTYFRTLEYSIEEEHLTGKWGVFWRKKVTIPYLKITNVDTTQGPYQRHFGIGSIHAQTAGYSGPEASSAELKMVGLKDFEKMRDVILEHVKSNVAGYTTKPATEADSAPSSLDKIADDVRSIRQFLETKK